MDVQGHILIRRKAKNGIDGANGEPGKNGLQGCILRQSEWAKGIEYRNDEALTSGTRYLDIAIVTTGANTFNAYKCMKTHTSSDSIPVTNTTYWQKFNSLVPVYTPLIMAQNAILRFMQGNQLLIMKSDNTTVTAGISGSIAGSKVRIWAGSATPDDAPFQVLESGKVICMNAEVHGDINATKGIFNNVNINSGTIAGFKISGNGLTNDPFKNDAYVVFRNDTHKCFAGIGGNVLPATTGSRAVARFENEDTSDWWGLGRNIAMILSAKNGEYNHAFCGSGNGNLDGWIGGYRYSKFTLSMANTIYDGYSNLKDNNRWVIYSSVSSSGITLPKLSDVRNALGISTSTKFCVEFTVISDIDSELFYIYGRNNFKNSSGAYPWNTTELPVLVHWDNGRWDDLTMGSGDSITVLLIYDPTKTGTKDGFSLYYTARVINRQN